MANKYCVRLGYYNYFFEERTEALDFAETAFNSQEEKKTVAIEFIRDEGKEQEGENDE